MLPWPYGNISKTSTARCHLCEHLGSITPAGPTGEVFHVCDPRAPATTVLNTPHSGPVSGLSFVWRSATIAFCRPPTVTSNPNPRDRGELAAICTTRVLDREVEDTCSHKREVCGGGGGESSLTLEEQAAGDVGRWHHWHGMIPHI